MAAEEMPSVDGVRTHPAVDALLQVAAAEFTDLGYLSPDGLLDIVVGGRDVRAVRIEAPTGALLHEQSICIDVDEERDGPTTVGLRSSSWRGDHEVPFEPGATFEIGPRAGPADGAVDGLAQPDRRAWAELRFARPLAVTRLRLRNAPVDTARRMRGIRVSVQTRWRSRAVYDGGTRLRSWRAHVARAKADAGADPVALALVDVVDLTVRGEYARAHTALAARVADDGVRRAFRDAVADRVLRSRGLEWTVHGPRRPFRSWTEEERIDYVRDTAGVVAALETLTPNVCLGFGSVLAVVRDKALIPHDDDLDVIVGFEAVEAATLGDALRRVEDHLRPGGFEVSGRFAAHRHVRRHRGKPVDVFVGIFEGDSISWYPGPRHGLTRSMVFPPAAAELLGVECPIPAHPEAYLERLYGPEWRVPDPYFSHTWDISAYADLTGDPQASA